MGGNVGVNLSLMNQNPSLSNLIGTDMNNITDSNKVYLSASA